MAIKKKDPNFLKGLKKGALTASLPKSAETKKGTLKVAVLEKLKKEGTPLEKKRATLALNFRKFKNK